MGTSENLKAGINRATGFIGGKLAERLASDGFSIRCLVRETSDTEKLRSLGAELVHGDLCDSNRFGLFRKGAITFFILLPKFLTGDRGMIFSAERRGDGNPS